MKAPSLTCEADNTVIDKTVHPASKAHLANTETDMIKWFVGLFLTLALMVVGLYFKK